MGKKGVDSSGTVLLQELRSSCDCVCSIGQVVDQDTGTTGHVADKHHGGVLPICDSSWATLLHQTVSTIRRRLSQNSYLVNEGKAEAEIVGDGGSTLRASGIRADNNCIPEPRNLSFDVPLEQRLSVEIIDGNVKETLVSDGRVSAPPTQSERPSSISIVPRLRAVKSQLRANWVRDTCPAPTWYK